MVRRVKREIKVEEAFLNYEPLWLERVKRMTGYGRIRAKRLMRELLSKYGGRKMRIGPCKAILRFEGD